MRKALYSVAFLALAGIAYATAPVFTTARPREASNNVISTCSDLQDQFGVAVASAPATNVVDASKVPWKMAVVQNMDASAKLYWHYQVNVSSNVNVSTANLGFRITAGSIQSFSLLPGVSYYMITDAAAPTAAVVQVCR